MYIYMYIYNVYVHISLCRQYRKFRSSENAELSFTDWTQRIQEVPVSPSMLLLRNYL